MALNLPEKGEGIAGRQKVFWWLIPSSESQVSRAASASKQVSRGQGQQRDGRRKCSDMQGTMKPGPSRGWTPHQAGQEAAQAMCVYQGQGGFPGTRGSALSALGVCSFSPFFQQEASCDPAACMRSKLHLSLFTSLSAEPTSPRHSPGRFISSDPKGFPQLFFPPSPSPP